jgi:hypothetical protein
MIRNTLSVGAFALIAAATLSISAIRAGAQEPGSLPTDGERIVGRWTGQTQGDGVLSVTLTADGRLGFQFTGGEKDHGYGTYQLQSPDRLFYTPHGETEAEQWTYGFDSAGRLKLKMEEDNPKDVEEYTLSRVEP